MSGIAGFWNRDGQPVTPEYLEEMGKVLAHRGPDGTGRNITQNFGIVAPMMFNTPESVGEMHPLVHPKSGTVFVFDGRLDNREEFAQNSKDSDAKLALHAYEEKGLSFAEHLKGDYAFALFNPKANRLVLGRDPLGVRPLYYSVQGSLIAFASEIKALLVHPRIKASPDKAILAEWLLNFACDRERTFFKDVQAVPPGHILIAEPDRIQVKEVWDFDPRQQVKLKSFKEAAEAYRFHLERAVRRQMRSAYPVALSVSGGLDSSSLYCLADKILKKEKVCPKFEAFSWYLRDGRAHDEYAFVESLAGPEKPPIHPVPMVSVGPFKTVERAVWMSEHPLLDSHWGNFDNIMTAAANSGARTFMTGLWSDQFFIRQGYLVDMLRKGRFLTMIEDFKNYKYWMVDFSSQWKFLQMITQVLRYHIPQGLKPLLRPFWKNRKYDDWYSEEFKSLARDRWKERWRPDKKSWSCHARDIYEVTKTGYMSMILEYDNKNKSHYGMDSVSPFLDLDLIQFLMSIPGNWVTPNGTPKGILREGMKGLLPDKIRMRRGKAHFTFISNESMDKDYYDIIDRLMTGREIETQGVVDLEKFAAKKYEMRRGLQTDSALASWALTNALGIEMLCQIYFPSNHKKECAV